LGDKPLMSATDSTCATGFLCLDADSQPISYSNIRVSAIQNQVTLDAPSPASFAIMSLLAFLSFGPAGVFFVNREFSPNRNFHRLIHLRQCCAQFEQLLS
jgi:hypothetical protein